MMENELNNHNYAIIKVWYREHYAAMVVQGLRMGYDKDQVKDAINQTFLVMLEMQDIDQIRNVRSYITTAFKRRLIDETRKKKVRTNYEEQLSLTDITDHNTFEHVLNEQAYTSFQKKLATAFEKLSPRCKEVLMLKYYEGLSNEHIAEHTGLSMRSVYNIQFEGVRKLRELLKNDIRNFNVQALLLLLSIPAL